MVRYEGTGRSLSHKLIAQLRQQSSTGNSASGTCMTFVQLGVGGRVLREVELKDPIRYAPRDPIEKWLNDLLCLDASTIPKVVSGYPAPQSCDLYLYDLTLTEHTHILCES